MKDIIAVAEAMEANPDTFVVGEGLSQNAAPIPFRQYGDAVCLSFGDRPQNIRYADGSSGNTGLFYGKNGCGRRRQV